MKKQAAARKKPAKTSKPQHPPVFYRVNALLHTIRTIEEHEDQLCTILHEIQNSGTLSKKTGAELRALLEEIPSREYQGDLEALRAALEA